MHSDVSKGCGQKSPVGLAGDKTSWRTITDVCLVSDHV